MSDGEESKGVPQEVEEKVDQPTEKTEEGESKTTAPQKASDSSSKPSGEGELAAELPPSQPVPSATESKAAGTASTVKQDWFQTLSDIFLDIMVKGVRREDVDVRFSESTVKVSIKLPNGEDYVWEFTPAHPINPPKSSYKVRNTKVELKMRKTAAVQWQSLEKGSGSVPKQFQAQTTDESAAHKYPSSSHHKKDWDKLVADVKKEEKDEKVEGDAALNKLFQQIYSDGSDEVRRAMNKSFVESGGTVLSTNWKEVGEKKVERKPPDGMEWKDYET